MPATASLFLSFIICVKGELEPTAADCPMLAIKTIENLAKISLSNIAWNNAKPLVNDRAIIAPITYNTTETIPAEPVDRERGPPPVEAIAGCAMECVGPPNQHVSRLQARYQDAIVLVDGRQRELRAGVAVSGTRIVEVDSAIEGGRTVRTGQKSQRRFERNVIQRNPTVDHLRSIEWVVGVVLVPWRERAVAVSFLDQQEVVEQRQRRAVEQWPYEIGERRVEDEPLEGFHGLPRS